MKKLGQSEKALRRRQTEIHLNSARILRGMERRIAELFAAEDIALTPAQGNLLVILFQAREPLTAKQLADAMNVSQVTVGRFVKALEQDGWIAREKDPNDARAFLVRATAKAYETLPALIGVSNAMLDAAFEGFSAEEVERLAAMTERICANLEGGCGE